MLTQDCWLSLMKLLPVQCTLRFDSSCTTVGRSMWQWCANRNTWSKLKMCSLTHMSQIYLIVVYTSFLVNTSLHFFFEKLKNTKTICLIWWSQTSGYWHIWKIGSCVLHQAWWPRIHPSSFLIWQHLITKWSQIRAP